MAHRPTRLYEAYVFDMDGTIYLGDELLPGAARLVTELRRREIPVIGDRLMTDIAMAADAGMASCLVLTGDSTREQSEALPAHRQPTYVVDRVDELLPATVWAERGWTAA